MRPREDLIPRGLGSHRGAHCHVRLPRHRPDRLAERSPGSVSQRCPANAIRRRRSAARSAAEHGRRNVHPRRRDHSPDAVAGAAARALLERTAALRDAVLLWRQREVDGALALLAEVPGLEAKHLALNVAQMHDLYDDIDSNADAILALAPGDPHALFTKALYAHAFDDIAAFTGFSARLRESSPTAAAALDRTVNDVALAWSTYPPLTPSTLPVGWNPRNLAIVAFGAPVRSDGTPTPSLQDRLDALLVLASYFPDSQIIASGGAVSSVHTESDFIRDYLLAHGVQDSRVVVDRHARDTLGNALFVADAVRDYALGSLLVDTSTYHSTRCTLTLRGALDAKGVDATILTVGAGNAGFAPGKELKSRLRLERIASHRDAARARQRFSHCDF